MHNTHLYIIKKFLDPEFGNLDLTWEEFFTMYQSGKIYRGDILDFIKSWWPHRNSENVHLVFYEDLVKNRETEIKKMAAFAGIEMSDNKLDKIVNASGLSAMQKNKGTNQTLRGMFDQKLSFVRKGKVGDWRDNFTVAQNEWMENHIKEKISELNIPLQYE